MFTHPSLISQLARDHQRQVLAAAGQRQLRRHHRSRACKAADTAATIAGRLATATPEPGMLERLASRGMATLLRSRP